MEVKFNIITRFSRKESIENLIRSIQTQSYTNYHHWITYEQEDDLPFLMKIVDISKTTFIKVTPYKQFKNLWMYYQYHDVFTNYLEKDWYEKAKVKIVIGEEPDQKLLDSQENDKIDEIFKYEKDEFWCSTINRTVTNICQHFPFNLYLKIVESKISNGWILHLDDDDLFEKDDSLEIIKKNIILTDENTIQIYRTRTRGFDNTELLPHDGYFQFMKTGHPIVHMECITPNFCFHSKYKEYTAWDEWRRADVRTIKSLERVIPKINYIDDIITKAGERIQVYA